MTPEEVLDTYDESYAARYNATFLLARPNGFLQKTRFELNVLRALTAGVDSWLDVGCGTGFFLRHGRGRSDLRVAGLDLSPAMLRIAAVANPDADLIAADFRDPQPRLERQWGLTSCMWGAYALQETIADVETLVDNLARWNRADGVCFLPVFDPHVLAAQGREGVLPAGMTVEDDGVHWSFAEVDGKCHRRVISPPVELMEDMLAERFQAIRRFAYPGTRIGVPMVGLLAGGVT